MLQQCQAAGTRDAVPSHLCHRGEVSSSVSWAATAEAAVSALFVINREKQALSGAMHVTSVRYLLLRGMNYILRAPIDYRSSPAHRHVKRILLKEPGANT